MPVTPSDMFRRVLLLICGVFLCCALPAQADLTSPVVAQTLPAQSLARAGSAATLNLYSYIDDPNVTGTAVRVSVNIGNVSSGNIDLALYDAQTPLTVANFLSYVNGGYYANNIVHRSLPGFIFQSGEYYFSDFANDQLAYVPTGPAVQNEPVMSNVAGTIAMAKVSGNVNSATNQWFINLVDNSANLDNQNGGFTAFGKIISNGMTVANQIAAVLTYNLTSYDYDSTGNVVASPPFPFDWTDMPLTAPSTYNTSFIRTSMAVVPAMTYNVTSANTSLVTLSLSGNTLTLTPSSTNAGTTNITINATDLEGAQLQTSFSVSILDTYDLWKSGIGFANSTVAAETADPDGDGLPNLAEYAFGGDPLHSAPVTGAPKAESGGGVTFYVRQLAAVAYEVDESTDLVNWTTIWQSSSGYSSAAVAGHTALTGFDQVTIRDPSPPPGNIHFWRVKLSRSL